MSARSSASRASAPSNNGGSDVATSNGLVGATLELAPVPDAAYALKLYYYQKALPLSAERTTNWLLTNFPNLYLFGSLVAAEAYLGTDPRLKLWGELYENLLAKLSAATERGQYGGAALSVKTDVVA